MRNLIVRNRAGSGWINFDLFTVLRRVCWSVKQGPFLAIFPLYSSPSLHRSVEAGRCCPNQCLLSPADKRFCAFLPHPVRINNKTPNRFRSSAIFSFSGRRKEEKDGNRRCRKLETEFFSLHHFPRFIDEIPRSCGSSTCSSRRRSSRRIAISRFSIASTANSTWQWRIAWTRTSTRPTGKYGPFTWTTGTGRRSRTQRPFRCSGITRRGKNIWYVYGASWMWYTDEKENRDTKLMADDAISASASLETMDCVDDSLICITNTKEEYLIPGPWTQKKQGGEGEYHKKEAKFQFSKPSQKF